MINGAIGAGKSTILWEISDLLGEVGVPHASIDLDALAQTFPPSTSDPFNLKLAVRNLRAVWHNASELGAEIGWRSRPLWKLPTNSTRSSPRFLERIHLCAGWRHPLSSCDEGSEDAKIGTALDWHLDRAVELAPILESGTVDDIVIATDDRPIRRIGLEILSSAGWPHPNQ